MAILIGETLYFLDTIFKNALIFLFFDAFLKFGFLFAVLRRFLSDFLLTPNLLPTMFTIMFRVFISFAWRMGAVARLTFFDKFTACEIMGSILRTELATLEAIRAAENI